MSVRVDGHRILLLDDCHVEQAETLIQAILADPTRSVDLSGCRHLHGAVAQVLLSYAVRVSGDPSDDFLRQFVAPAFNTRKDRLDDQ